MAIELPQLDSFCEMLTVCSRLEGDVPETLPQEAYEVTASYSAKNGKALVHLVWDYEKRRHLHVDVALRAVFGAKAPKTTGKISEIRKLLVRFDGAKIKATIIGFFRIPLTSLPPTGGLIFAGSNAIRLKVNKTAIEMTGAQLTFQEADISNLRWEQLGDYIYLDMVAHRDLAVSADYLNDSLAILETALSVYILGKTSDEKTNA